MGCSHSSAQFGRDGGIFRAGAGIIEGDAAARRGEAVGVTSAVEDFAERASAAKAAEVEARLTAGLKPGPCLASAGNSAAAANVIIDIGDHRNMDSPAARQKSFASWLLLLFVRLYQTFFSPFLGGACKFYPSCSRYAQEAIALHGARRGAWLAMKRLGRCRPFTKGGCDPVPDVVLSPSGAKAPHGGTACMSELNLRPPENRTTDYRDADWLRTASKERVQ
jgi:uncharacterized protein